MTMDVGTNSNAEPNPKVSAAAGSANPADSATPPPLEGAVMKALGDIENNSKEPYNGKEQQPTLELSAQLEEIAALSRRNTAAAVTNDVAPNVELPVPANAAAPKEMPAESSEKDVMSCRGVRYSQGEGRYATENLTISKSGDFLQWFYDLPVSSKQLIGLISSEVISVIGLVGAGSLLIISGARQQLLKQAAAELSVMDIQYSIKVNQMGFGFRGQSENTAIVELAEGIAKQPDEVSSEQRSTVRKILQGEIEARNIEYATLVGIDGKIIVNAQTDRTGEEFNPYDLVSRVVSQKQQLKLNGLVERSELQRQNFELSTEGDTALIRYVATPVFAQNKPDELVGVLIAGDVVNGKSTIVETSVQVFGTGYDAIYLFDGNDTFQLAASADLDEGEDEIELGEEIYDEAILNLAVQNQGKAVSTRLVEPGGSAYAMSAKTLDDINGEPIGVLVRGTSESNLQTLINRSLQIQFAIVLLAILADILLAQLLGRAVASPIKRLQQATEAFSGGNRQIKADVFASDEVGQLAAAFNDLTAKVAQSEGTLINQASIQEEAARRSSQLASLTSDLRKNNIDQDRIFSIAVNEIRKAIEADRVVVYRFNEDWSGEIVSESVAMGWPAALGANINDPCFANNYVDKYRQGRVQVTNNIFEAGLTACHLGQLKPFKVQANLVAPIVIVENGELLGLLVAHQCSGPRNWSELDISFFKQAALQVGLSVEQMGLFNQKQQAQLEAEALSEERRQRQETLQMELLSLLDDVEGAARGDLTVRADVSAGEIGTVADFFNAIIESLRQIVTQVKTSAVQVNTSLGDNEAAMEALAEDALKQAERTTKTLDSVETMTMAITHAADRAQQAAVVAREASQTAETGGAAMDLTVQNILALRTTVGETAKKVKRLGESSQQISKVVSLINQIATQTNLLAINAGIEAARAGEEGQGFAAVAEEVGELAARSAAATQDIERIVDSIQRETADVVEAIESSTSQVVEGTRRVDEAKQSLTRMMEVSQQIDALVQTISAATVSQVETAADVSTLMQEISLVSERTSSSSKAVSDALKQTVTVAKELELSMAAFKVDE
ncbi:methyl-accepting chemotaxis protein [Leptothoe sp. PORK10 BA2]|uniref:methyl-accepting chemotaxis protein n=1 Tax=Leptothoe sp. PORK10 BA2 TaxID=3110254 RepID=UPI002B1F7765|nr:methyl-accepting chemotaxis protein [Leptothoe sp. PORK10 BA2]MEA5465255.1 methyl-accepting chemotaxis protein [Leptothoe sp. PORK10 BA2]